MYIEELKYKIHCDALVTSFAVRNHFSISLEHHLVCALDTQQISNFS